MGQKIKIKLSYFTYNTLLHDMEIFDFLKNDGSVNKNLFINTLVYNYSTKINSEIDFYNKEATKKLKDLNLNETKINEIINIFSSLNSKEETKENLECELTFLVTSKFESAFEEIEANYLSTMNMSEYLRKLFNSYSMLHQDEREKIVFKHVVDFINAALKENKYLTIKVKNSLIKTVPLGLFTSKERLFNYYIYKTKYYPIPVKISKIHPVALSKELIEPHDKEIEIDGVMSPSNIQFVGHYIENIAIKLTKNGQKLFKKIFLNRPTPKKIDGDIYYFDANPDAIVFYFSRFGKDALVLNNRRIYNEIYQFYKDGYKEYTLNKDKYGTNKGINRNVYNIEDNSDVPDFIKEL